MSPAADVAEKFIQSIAAGKFEAARQLLASDFSFVGPFDTFDSAEPYLAALQRLHPMVSGVKIRKLFVDGDDVCVLYDLSTNSPAGTAFVCEWMQLRGGKIASVRAVFDARPFAAAFGGG
jgi:SnoaL-like protein